MQGTVKTADAAGVAGEVGVCRTRWEHECPGADGGCDVCTLVVLLEPFWDMPSAAPASSGTARYLVPVDEGRLALADLGVQWARGSETATKEAA